MVTVKRQSPRRRDVATEDIDVTDVEPDEDEDEVEPAPRRRRAPVAEYEEEEEEAPAPRRRQAPVEDDEEPAPRRRRVVEDDEEDAPPRRPAAPAARKVRAASPVRVGWVGAEETRKKSSAGDKFLRPQNEPELVAFLSDEPISWAQHWVSPTGSQADRRSHTCLGDDCPLCDIGDRPVSTFCFNVLQLSNVSVPQRKLLQLGVKAYGALKDAATSRKTGKVNLVSTYWAESKSGKGQQSQANFRPVKKADVGEDWPEVADQFSTEEIEEMVAEAQQKLYGPEVVVVESTRVLRELARQVSEDD